MVPGLCGRDGDRLSFLERDWLLGEALRFRRGRTGLLAGRWEAFLGLLFKEGVAGVGVAFIRGSPDIFPHGLCP